MTSDWVRSPRETSRRGAVDRAGQAVEREFVRGILILGTASVPIVATVALITWDASIALLGALSLTAALLAWLQLRRPQPSVLPVVLVIVTVAAAQLPVQPSENRAAMMVGVAALGALGGLFVERRYLRWYLGYLSLVWAGQLIWAADQGEGVFEAVDHSHLFGMAVQLAIFGVLGAALHVVWRTVTGTEQGYRNLFDRAPTSLWEEDYSEVTALLENLRQRGVRDLRAHLDDHPELVEEAIGLVRVNDVNDAAVALIEADERSDLLGAIDARTVDQGTFDSFIDQLVAIWEGRDRLVVEYTGRTIRGRPIDCVLHWSVPIGRRGPDYSRVLVSISDVSDITRVQRELSRKNAVLNSIAGSQARFINDAEPADLFRGLLDELVYLTGSDHGFIGEIEQNGGSPRFRMHAVTNTPWDDRSRRQHAQGLEIGDAASLFGAALIRGETVISNEPRSDHRMHLLPDGHPQLTSFLGLPLRYGDEIVGMIGIANRPDGYTAEMADSIEPFVASCSNLIVAYRSEQRRQEAERALQRAEKRLRLIAENVADLLHTTSEDGVFLFLSDSVQRILGYRAEELVGKSSFDLIHPDDLEIIRASKVGVPPGGASQPAEHRVRHADGSWRLIESSAVNMLHDPDVGAWVVNSRDVTLGKEAEAELQRARDAAEQAAASKSQFLANISHEIRTPMNAILGMTELALGTELTAEQREYLGTTKTSVDALLTLINDLLDLSKIEAGKLELEEVPFSLGDTVGDTVRTMAVRAAEKGLHLSTDLSPSVPDAVVGDPGRVRQILFNLIGNAVKFTHVGHVRVIVDVDANTTSGSEVHFIVEDTGIGIPEEARDTIFESFSQADGSMTRRYGGTGLGLAITADLVQMMGGRIWVESKVGEGSRFHFTVTLRHASITDLLGPLDSQPRTDLRVLVIADAVALQRNLGEILRQGNMAATVVSDLGAAFDTIHDLGRLSAAPQAVVVDLRANVLEACARLVNSPEFEGVPVIAISVAGERGDAARYRSAGVAAYLTKPVTQGEVLDAVRLVTSKHFRSEILVTKHWLRERRPRLRILLADDSPTNRMLAIRLLEKRGHSVVAVEDGLRAVEAVQESSFDAVLMDVQMPELDGLEATEVIRQWEGDGPHIPIVALTAHAMESDRERCQQAGMDAYVAKPFSADELYATVEQLVGSSSRSGADAQPRPADTKPVINRQEALERVEGMGELLKEMAEVFLEEYPALRDGIAADLANGTIEAAREISHRIKGTVGLFAAHGPFEAAKRMNDLAKADDFPGTCAAWEALEDQMDRLVPELQALVERGVAAWA